MPQNPFADLMGSSGDPFADLRNSTNPFGDLMPQGNEPRPAQPSTFGRVVDPLVKAGSTAVGTVLDYVGRPQAAAFGAVLEGPEGFKAGLTGEKKYTGKDVLGVAGWEGDSWGKAGAGLALDLVADPVNLVGLGPIKKGYQALVKGGAELVDTAARVTPGVRAAYKGAEAFLDPHAALKPQATMTKWGELRDYYANPEANPVNKLKDKARLAESAARAVDDSVHRDVATIVGKNIPFGAQAGAFVRTFDEPTRAKIAYAVDKGDLSNLSPEELNVANKFKAQMQAQWDSELPTKHQGAQRGPLTSTGKLPKSAQPAPKIENYVTYVTKPDAQRNVSVISDIRGTTRHSKPRKFESLEAAVAGGNATDDLAVIAHARLSSGRKAQLGSEILTDFAKEFGSTTPKAGWRKLNIPEFTNLPHEVKAQVADKFMPPQAADYLERSHAVMNKPDDVLNAYQQGVRVYKQWLLTNPQQIATNLLGNVLNSFYAGKVPSVKNMRLSVPVVMKGAIPPSIGKYSGEEILAGMKKYGILGGQGQYQDTFAKGANYSLNPLRSNFLGARGMQFINQHGVEEPFKAARYLQNIEDGMDLGQAALKTDDVFFNYAEVSPAAKKLRDYGVIPFITWQIKNLPMQVENLAMRPQKFAQTESVMDAVSDPNALVPHQDTREGMIPTSENKTFRFASPINDLNKLPIGDYQMKDLALDTIGQSLGLKQLVELTSSGKYPGTQGRKLYNDAPIWREGQDGTVPFDAVSQMAQKLGLGAMVGIGENNMGEQAQNELMAYLLQQNPWQYYGRNLIGPPDELVQKGAVRDPKDETVVDTVGNIFGFRTKDIKPKDELAEMQRRLKMILEP